MIGGWGVLVVYPLKSCTADKQLLPQQPVTANHVLVRIDHYNASEIISPVLYSPASAHAALPCVAA